MELISVKTLVPENVFVSVTFHHYRSRSYSRATKLEILKPGKHFHFRIWN